MFGIFRARRIRKYTEEASVYIWRNFVPERTVPTKETPPRGNVRYSKKEVAPQEEIQYSLRGNEKEDAYDASAVANVMRSSDYAVILKVLERRTDKTFVEMLRAHIQRSGLRDAEVYKAAQIDRRLFSKIMSDKNYKPAKDTAIALCLALQLSIEDTADLLSRAGHILSHSNKKDILIEYFLREKIYKLSDINEVLFNLGERPLGR